MCSSFVLINRFTLFNNTIINGRHHLSTIFLEPYSSFFLFSRISAFSFSAYFRYFSLFRSPSFLRFFPDSSFSSLSF